jgi:rubrerythrin
MEEYEVRYTVDESGARSCAPQGWLHSQTPNAMLAVKEAMDLSRAGSCAFVRRVRDGAILGEDGDWIAALRIVKCLRCGHAWPTKGQPRVCPKCKSPYWDRPKKGAG